MSFVTSIGISNPPHRFAQSELAEFMIRAMNLSEDEKRKTRSLYKATGIDTRYSVLEDYGRQTGFEFYANTPNLEPFPSTEKRILQFRQHALNLSIASVEKCLEERQVNAAEISHLVVVSCTGLYAPGLDIDLVKAMGFKSTVQRTCINFMGCYAAFNAMKVADALCKSDPHAKVLVVCTELCSLHFQKQKTEDNILANALFADGSAALLMEAQAKPGWQLVPEHFHCDLFARGEDDMSWSVGDLGFEMRLSSYVPTLIQHGIKDLSNSLLAKASNSTTINYFAIHPGGKRILDVVEQELDIPREKNRFSHDVLRKYGNMSSPTILFVLHAIMDQLKNGDETGKILSFAFGPGLTLESMLLKIERH